MSHGRKAHYVIASAIAFIVQGFRVHWGWGVASLFLGPLAGIPFFYSKHRQEGSVPFYVLAHGLILLLVIVMCLIIYKAVA